jgi:hypothetical protein
MRGTHLNHETPPDRRDPQGSTETFPYPKPEPPHHEPTQAYVQEKEPNPSKESQERYYQCEHPSW